MLFGLQTEADWCSTQWCVCLLYLTICYRLLPNSVSIYFADLRATRSKKTKKGGNRVVHIVSLCTDHRQQLSGVRTQITLLSVRPAPWFSHTSRIIPHVMKIFQCTRRAIACIQVFSFDFCLMSCTHGQKRATTYVAGTFCEEYNLCCVGRISFSLNLYVVCLSKRSIAWCYA